MDKAVVMQWVVVKDGFEIGNGGIDLHFANAYEAFSQEQYGLRKVTENGPKMVPKWSENGPKMVPKGARDHQKGSKSGPGRGWRHPRGPPGTRCSQEEPRWRPRGAKVRPKGTQQSPKVPQDGFV